jgi:hypothetical protein
MHDILLRSASNWSAKCCHFLQSGTLRICLVSIIVRVHIQLARKVQFPLLKCVENESSVISLKQYIERSSFLLLKYGRPPLGEGELKLIL